MKAQSGPKAEVEVAVRRKGEDDFTIVETKRLPGWVAQKLAKLKGLQDDSRRIR